MSLVFISFITKTKQMTLVFEWLKTKLMKTNIICFVLIVIKLKTLTTLVFIKYLSNTRADCASVLEALCAF